MEKYFGVDSREVTEALQNLEHEVLLQEGLQKISGGYSRAEIFSYDDEYFDIELHFGVQSDCENNSYCEQLKMCRKTLKIID